MKIFYASFFIKKFKKLESKLQKNVAIKEKLFKDDSLHPFLRAHPFKEKLKGFWSISINNNYRIIFKRKDSGDIVFYSI